MTFCQQRLLPRLCRSQNPAPHSGPLDPKCCGLSPLLQPSHQSLPYPHPSFPFSPYSMCFLSGSHALVCLGIMHTLLLCQEPPDPLIITCCFLLYCHLSFSDIFSESSYTHPLARGPQFSPPLHLIISFLGHFKCVIVDQSPRL